MAFVQRKIWGTLYRSNRIFMIIINLVEACVGILLNSKSVAVLAILSHVKLYSVDTLK